MQIQTVNLKVHKAVLVAIRSRRAAATPKPRVSLRRKLKNKLRKSKMMILMRHLMSHSPTLLLGTIKMSRTPQITTRERINLMTTLKKSRHLMTRKLKNRSSSLVLTSCLIGLPKKLLRYYLISQYSIDLLKEMQLSLLNQKRDSSKL
jgi:hypothetical protein